MLITVIVSSDLVESGPWSMDAETHRVGKHMHKCIDIKDLCVVITLYIVN